jgi:hypothetical protein
LLSVLQQAHFFWKLKANLNHAKSCLGYSEHEFECLRWFSIALWFRDEIAHGVRAAWLLVGLSTCQFGEILFSRQIGTILFESRIGPRSQNGSFSIMYWQDVCCSVLSSVGWRGVSSSESYGCNMQQGWRFQPSLKAVLAYQGRTYRLCALP